MINRGEFAEDGQGRVVGDSSWSPFRTEKVITFVGGTTDGWGDEDGALDGASVFDVQGTVRARTLGIIETTLVGAGTIELGVTGNTAVIIAQVADATSMAANEIWHDATVDAAVEADTVASALIIANGLNMILTIGSANITAGKIRFITNWYPLSLNGLVSPSGN